MSDNKSAIDLTPLQREKIERAAKKLFPDEVILGKQTTNRFTYNQIAQWQREALKAGASYYEKEVMPGMMVEFAEWVVPKVFAWLNDPESDKDLIYADLAKQFLSHLKHNQDAGSENKG